MTKQISILIILSLISCASYLHSEEKKEDAPLLPRKAIDIALKQNRDLVAARYAVQQAKGRLVQAGLWPNPALQISNSTDGPFNNEGEYAFSTGFQQKFPISGRLGKAKALARVDVAMAFAEIRNIERLLAGEVQGRAQDLLVLQERLNTNMELQGTIKNFITVSEKRLALAEVSVTDVNLSKLELQKLTLARAGLVTLEKTATIALNQLLGRDPQSPLKVGGEIQADIDTKSLAKASEMATTMRPDRQLAAMGIDRAAAEIQLARAQRWQDWTMGFGYSRDQSSFDGYIPDQRDSFVGFSISIPLPIWNKNQGRISEAQATRERAQAELSALDLRITTEAHTAENEIRRLHLILHQYQEESLVLAEENIRLLQKGYGEGLVQMTAVFQAQQQYIDLRQSYWGAVRKFLQALTDWDVATASFPFLNEPETKKKK